MRRIEQAGPSVAQPEHGEPPQLGEHRYPPWGWRECLLGLITAVVCLLLLSAGLSVFAAARGDTSTRSLPNLLAGLLVTLGFELTLFAIATGITAGRYPGGLRLLGWCEKPVLVWIRWSVLAVVLAWLTLGLYAFIVHVLGLNGLEPKSNVPEGIFEHRQTVALAVVITVLVAPVVEETFFRGFLFNGLRRRFGFAGAASVSGALFALAHVASGGTIIIPFTVIGVILAFTYYRGGTLWASVTAHMTFNLVSVVAILAAGGKG